MKWTRRSIVELATILAMIIVVVVLAIFQYRWTGEISRSEQDRLKSTLGASVRNFNQDFSYDFERLCERFEIGPQPDGASLENTLLRQYTAWTKATPDSGLVENLRLWRFYAGRSSYLETFNVNSKRFENGAWPVDLAPLHGFLAKRAGELPLTVSDRQAVYYPWTFYGEVPAFIRPVFQSLPDNKDSDLAVRPVAFLVIELSGQFLRESYLPRLVDRDFGRLGFDAAIRNFPPHYQGVYSSKPEFPIAISSPDASVNLWDSVGEEARRRGHPSVEPSGADGQWQLVAQHSSGSLDVAVASLRRRNLAISLGLLAILAGSLALVFSGAHRAERFAKLRMEFVAGVSHEICTPLAVIHSAVENLADGVVEDPARVREYANILRDQGGQLERLLDQMFSFAAGRFSKDTCEVRPVDIASIVVQSISVSEPWIRDAGFELEKDIRADLPRVSADPDAVSKCVENLISNAIKYGGAKRWMLLRTQVKQERSQAEVQISVEDKGAGISPEDLEQIFEPFYRVRTSRDGHIRGVGLGLFLVKQMMEAMGGRVTVRSQTGQGTCFVLHFPVPDAARMREQVPA